MGRLKLKFGAVREKYRGDRGDNYTLLFELCVALTNFDISKRPLRREEGIAFAALEDQLIRENRIRYEDIRTERRNVANRRRGRFRNQ